MNIQLNYNLPSIKQLGFTLIEAMVAFAVAGVGILAVVSFQTELVSTSAQSKAKAEAIQLAQERLEEFKNYSFKDAGDFNASDAYATTTYEDTADTYKIATYGVTAVDEITGTNAIFTRDYSITTSGDLKAIAVKVSWVDVKDSDMSVTLNTSMTYEKQSLLAADQNNELPTVTSATGSATIGAGTTDCGADGVECVDSGDGTTITKDGDDLKLVIKDDDGDSDVEKVVLTLSDACVGSGCTQFVQIRGRAFIDTDTQSSLFATGVHIESSDAAYCQNFYLKNGGNAIDIDDTVVYDYDSEAGTTTYYLDSGTTVGVYDATDTLIISSTDYNTAYADAGINIVANDGSTVDGSTIYSDSKFYIDSGIESAGVYDSTDTELAAETDLSSAPSTTDYIYFRYTCYLGGGWHGAIGLSLYNGGDGNYDNDAACIGDPNADIDDFDKAFEPPVLALARVYRGMTFRYTVDSDDDGVEDSVIETWDHDNDSNTSVVTKYYSQGIKDAAQIDGQDFIIAEMGNNDEEGICVADDADTSTPYTDDTSRLAGIMTRADSTNGTLFADVPDDWYCLNDGNITPELPYANDSTCPFDPTNSPKTFYTITAGISAESDDNFSINADDGLTYTDPDDSTIKTEFMVTVSSVSSDETERGQCTFDAIDDANDPIFTSTYTCSEVYDWEDDGWTGSIVVSDNLANISCTLASTPTMPISIAANETNDVTGPVITCEEGIRFTISGNITYSAATTDLSDGDITMTADAANGGDVTCTVSGASSYTCTSGLMAIGTTEWTGIVAIARASGDFSCYSGDGTLSPKNIAALTLSATPVAPEVSLITDLATDPADKILYNTIDSTTNYSAEHLYIDKDNDCI